MTAFFLKVWEWLKAHWKWVLFPIGILFAVVEAYLYITKRKVQVIAPGSTAANAAAQKAQELADKKAAEAEAERQKKLDEIKKEHDAVIKKLTDEQAAEVKALEENPDKLNAYLLNIGQQMRG